MFGTQRVRRDFLRTLLVGVESDQIVPFPHPFSYFQNEYEYEYGYYQIRMRSGCYSNTDADRMFYQFETNTNNTENRLMSYN